MVTADEAVAERHREILCYDRDEHRFEMQPILRHLTVHVPQEENVRITSNRASITTSCKHPVLVHRGGEFRYVRADEVGLTDALVHHNFRWTGDPERSREAWFAGAHLGDGSAHEKKFSYKPTRSAWAQRAAGAGRRLVFKIRAAEREVVERYAEFFKVLAGSQAKVTAATTPHGTAVWDYAVSSFEASRAEALIDGQIGDKCATLRVPKWIASEPERHFLPFIAGLIDTDGTVSTTSAAQRSACRARASQPSCSQSWRYSAFTRASPFARAANTCCRLAGARLRRRHAQDLRLSVSGCHGAVHGRRAQARPHRPARIRQRTVR